jgi:hypothetical protein
MAQITAADFSSNSLSGTTTVLNGFANVTLQSVPYALEGDKTFVVALRRGSPSGEVLTRSLPITLNDNSEFVSFTSNVSSISEGNLISYTLVTANAIDGAKVYYSLTGAVNSNTYLEGAGFDNMYRVSPNFDAGGGSTFANNTVLVANPTTKFINDIENITPGGRIYITNYNGALQHNYITIVSSGNVSTNDDVVYYRIISEEFIDPPVSGDVSAGNLYIEYINTANLYYTANVDGGDFDTGNTGFITVNNNEATLTLRASNDLIYEQIENYNVQLRTNSIVGNIIYNSSGVSIEDTSYSVTYVSNSWNAAFYESGDTATFTFATLNEKSGRTYYYELEGNTNSSQFGLTSTGTFAVINNQGTLTTTIGSIPTGGTNNFRLVVKENDASGTVVARSDEIVLNPVLYTLATGGTMTYANSSIIHEFTTSGTFEVTQAASSVSKQTAQVFLVGGGGSSSGGATESAGGGGGGYHVANVTLDSTGVSTVIVASGGSAPADVLQDINSGLAYHSTSPAPFALGAGGDTYITGHPALSPLRARGGGAGSGKSPSGNSMSGGVSGNVNNTATVFGPQRAAPLGNGGASGGGADGEAKFAFRRFSPDTTYPYPGGTTTDSGMLYSDTYSDYGIYLPEPYFAGGKGVFSDIYGKGRYYGGGGGAYNGVANPAAPGVIVSGSRGGWGGGGRGAGSPTYGNQARDGRQNSGGGGGGSNSYPPRGKAGGSGIAYIKYPFQGVRDLNNANNEGLLNSNLYPEVIYSVDNEIISFDYSNLLGPNQTLNYYTTGNVTSSMFIGGNTGSVVLPNTGNAETSSFTLQLNSSNIPTSGVLQFNVNLAFSGTDLAVSNTFLVTADTSITNATGGEITYADGYKIHTFKSSGTFTVNNIGAGPATAEYVLVGGGGAGGGYTGQTWKVYGGGGAGGFIESSNTLTLTSYPVIVGGGGLGGYSRTNPSVGLEYLGDWLGSEYAGRDGSNTSFFGQTAYGGGGGGGEGGTLGSTAPDYMQYQDSPGYPGGSSGGNGISSWNNIPMGYNTAYTLGSSANIKLPIDPGQGFPGGVYATGGDMSSGHGAGGGGGGAGGRGANATVQSPTSPTNYAQAGPGGTGKETFILGYPLWLAGGGGGGGGLYGRPGLGGGGAGTAYAENVPNRYNTGNVNTGGGGGGAAGGGGSGIVIVRYPFINI